MHELADAVTDRSALYINAMECVSMAVLYARILRELKCPQTTVCNSATELVIRLQDLSGTNYALTLLIEDVQLVYAVDAAAFAVLLRLPELTDGRVRLCCSSPEPFECFCINGAQPVTVRLPSLDVDTVCRQIAEECRVSPSVVTTIQQFLAPLSRDEATLRLLAQQHGLSLQHSPNQNIVRAAKARLEAAESPVPLYQQLSDDLSRLEKFLLLAGFVASFQSVRDDVKIFGAQHAPGRKRTRLGDGAEPSADRPASKLPRLFDQTRLFAIFYHILQAPGVAPTDKHDLGVPALPALQAVLRGLAARGMLCPVGRLDACKYRFNLSQDLAHHLAKSVSIDLNNYLLRGE